MQVTGYIGTTPERKEDARGKVYFKFRLAESFGRAETRRTTWYDVFAYLSDREGRALYKTLLVTVKGELKARVVDSQAGPRVALPVMAYAVEPFQKA